MVLAQSVSLCSEMESVTVTCNMSPTTKQNNWLTVFSILEKVTALTLGS